VDEPFGPEYLRPTQKDCPRCSCCTEALCERGRNSPLECRGHTPAELQETVTGCPCSAETTRHTAAWRAAQVRVTRMAREKPLPPEVEGLLRALAGGQVVDDPDGLFAQARAYGLAQSIALRPVLTPLGRTYLAAKDDVRSTTAVRVRDVDTATRTARVNVASWRPTEPVTVLLDQIVSDSGVDAGSLPGRWLEAEANSQAEDADRLVLTGFRVAGPQAAGDDDE
jgi:hypothetical protein